MQVMNWPESHASSWLRCDLCGCRVKDRFGTEATWSLDPTKNNRLLTVIPIQLSTPLTDPEKRLAVWRQFVLAVCVIVMFTSATLVDSSPVWAQVDGEITDAADIASIMNDEPEPEAAEATGSGIDLYSLFLRGGLFMVPIAVMSMLVVSLAVERMLAFRKNKMIPKRLRSLLSKLVDDPDFDPEAAFQACQNYPSASANVIRSMLLRTGQPLGDIERTASEAVQREADHYAGPIRWLNLAAAATPLMGLLGTVWGMIVAFHQSSTLTAGQSRSEQLSEGIYTALVTTLAGLIVAIPAAIFAQYLENRIAKLFHQIELLAFEGAPSLQRFVGKRQLSSAGRLMPMSVLTPPPPTRDPPTRDPSNNAPTVQRPPVDVDAADSAFGSEAR